MNTLDEELVPPGTEGVGVDVDVDVDVDASPEETVNKLPCAPIPK